MNANNNVYTSRLPEDRYLWKLYELCIKSEAILKEMGYREREDKIRRRLIPKAFDNEDKKTLENILNQNLYLIKTEKVVPIGVVYLLRSYRK